jgi:hypothetical protein
VPPRACSTRSPEPCSSTTPSAHLFDLARAVQPAVSPPRRRPARQRVRPAVQYILDAMTGAAAFVRNDRLDILGGNQLGYALYAPMFENPIRRPVNTARFLFLDARARDFYLDWDRAACDTVAVMRSAAGRDPHDRDLSDLVGELSTQSEPFRAHWASHNVRFHINGIKRFHHPIVGELSLNFERLELAGEPASKINRSAWSEALHRTGIRSRSPQRGARRPACSLPA